MKQDYEFLELTLQIHDITISTLKIPKEMTDILLFFKSEVS